MKIDFIICTNNELWYAECKKYIDNLIVPANAEIEVIAIRNASGMTQGYAAGSTRSNADYKVYLHQDTFIINRHFIEDIKAVFDSDDRIGVIGMIGSNAIERHIFSWEGWECGKTIGCNGVQETLFDFGTITGKYETVDSLDGMILVTRYDVPWREDIFTGWHFYDRSICMEYRRKGYLCVVPRQESPWCIHDSGISDLHGWNEGLLIFLEEYSDFFDKEYVLSHIKPVDEQERQQIGAIAQNIEMLIDSRRMDEAARLLHDVAKSEALPNKKIVFLINLLEIYQTGKCNMFFSVDDRVSDMQEKYVRAAFLLRRKLYGLSLSEKDNLFLSELTKQERAVIARHELTLHNQIAEDTDEVLSMLEQIKGRGHTLAEALKDRNAEGVASNAIVLAAMIDDVLKTWFHQIFMNGMTNFFLLSVYFADIVETQNSQKQMRKSWMVLWSFLENVWMSWKDLWVGINIVVIF